MAFVPVILVVGAYSKYKAHVSEALAKRHSGGEVRRTEAGVVNYRTEGRPVVVESTSWNVNRKIMEGRNLTEIVDDWISSNILNELFGKLVSVVCVIDLTSLQHKCNLSKSKLHRRIYAWLTLLADIFLNCRATITIVVRIKGSENVSTNTTKNRIRELLVQDGFEESNIVFRRQVPKVGEDPEIPLTLSVLTPREELHISNRPVKLILFGRTGSGKSTLAQMLTLQKLDSCSNAFPSNSGVDGKSLGVKHGQGRGWYVVDTPGLGKPSEKLSSTSTHHLAMKMFEEIQLTHGLFTHFIYVKKRDRFDTLDDEIWRFFMQIFGEHIKSNFTVVITNSGQAWVETHMDALRESFTGCESFLSADFPTIEPDDKELEEENCKVRVESLKQLEEGLAILGRHPVECNKTRQVSKTTEGHGFRESVSSVKDATKRAVGRARTISGKGATNRMRGRALFSTAKGVANTNPRDGNKWKRMFKSTRP